MILEKTALLPRKHGFFVFEPRRGFRRDESDSRGHSHMLPAVREARDVCQTTRIREAFDVGFHLFGDERGRVLGESDVFNVEQRRHFERVSI